MANEEDGKAGNAHVGELKAAAEKASMTGANRGRYIETTRTDANSTSDATSTATSSGVTPGTTGRPPATVSRTGTSTSITGGTTPATTSAPQQEADAPAAAAPAPKTRKKSDVPVFAMLGIFVVSIAIGMIHSTIIPPEYKAFGDQGNSVLVPILYIGLVIAFTALVLFIVKKGLDKVIKYILLFAIGMTVIYTFYPYFFFIPPLQWALVIGGFYIIDLAMLASMVAGVALMVLLVKWPEWYIINAVGILVSAGAVAIFGTSLGIYPTLLLLAILALYDAISVYKTKHMISLADSVMAMQLPVLVVLPKDKNYSFKKPKPVGNLKKELDDGKERDAMFMGLGDIVIPGVLVVSALANLPGGDFHGIYKPLLVSLATLVGGVLGYGLLMWFVVKGKPQAGLPMLNTGVIVFYLASCLVLYGQFGIRLSFGFFMPGF
jgi:presenilin-like A22 family membrane protease